MDVKANAITLRGQEQIGSKGISLPARWPEVKAGVVDASGARPSNGGQLIMHAIKTNNGFRSRPKHAGTHVVRGPDNFSAPHNLQPKDSIKIQGERNAQNLMGSPELKLGEEGRGRAQLGLVP